MIRPSGARVRSPGGFEEPGLWVQRGGAWVPVVRRTLPWGELRLGWECDHRRMRSHCHPRCCGHLLCPDCGLFWDVGADCG